MELLNDLVNIDLNYITVCLILIFYLLEQILNKPFTFKRRPQHLYHNALIGLTFLIPNVFYAVFQVACVEWLNNEHVGLIYLLQIPSWVKLICGVALYDLTAYWIHRGAHKNAFLWRFHRVHHSDTTMDASTVLRAHPLEGFFVFGIGFILAAAFFGTDVLSLGLYFFVLNIFFFFEHSNLQYPTWLDKTIGWVLVTPNQHKVHHEQDQAYTDSNFADIFILWDRIFGTYKYKPLKSITYGLKEFDKDKKQTFWYQIRSPFINIKRIDSDTLQSIHKT